MISALQNRDGATASSVTGSDATSIVRGNNRSEASLGASPFGDLLAASIGNLSRLEDQARAAVDGLMNGSGVDVHQAMIASEKANMAFELALAVRNKAIQSYQSVMSMQF